MSLSTEHIITLLKTPKFGQVSVKYINANIKYKISNLRELLDAINELKSYNSKLPIPNISDLENAFSNSEMIMSTAERKSIKILSCNDINYPIRLKRLNDYPSIIYYKGSLAAINAESSVAVIGTREPSIFGIKAGRRMASIFADHGFSIVSGLAIGCDSAGHLGALDVGGQTVCVLANGVDIIYPKENTALAERILEADGALLSEYEPGAKAFRQSFVQRDRLQSGLSDGLIVLETDIKGGTMHTVGFAKNINIPIACLSGHPENLRDHPKTKGTQYLVNNGAIPLSNQNQIYSYLKLLNPNVIITKSDEGKNFSAVLEERSKIEANIDVLDQLSNVSNDFTADETEVQASVKNDEMLPAKAKGSELAIPVNEIVPDKFVTLSEFRKVSEELETVKRKLILLEETLSEFNKVLPKLLKSPSTKKEKKVEDKEQPTLL
ncbi:DNA-processing protein DprA [Pedobacter sp. BMA]|uniref:DNA-processing protein DprA n=1 Tax=Pedobacter sp. BMA TaxID=1663685 RepID=UPI00069E717E|nr:DNA-processing protein DprA [Pedobacter sp. BMA]